MELFIAIGLEKQDAARLAAFSEAELKSCPAEHPDDLHITLHYIGETDQVNEIAERLTTVAYPPFCLVYTELNAFLRQEVSTDVVWQGVSDPENRLSKLRDTVAEALNGISFRQAQAFTPHITLSYAPQPVDLAELRERRSPLEGNRWEIQSFQLWQVLPGSRRPAFRKIADYRLSALEPRGEARLLCVNDFHGALWENQSDLGAPRLVTAVNAYVQRHPETGVVFGGDNCFGEPVSDLFQGKPVLDMMRLMGTGATVLGNHDLDSPVEDVAAWSGYGGFPLLAANLVRAETGENPGFVQPYTVLSVNGYRIALLGLCTVEDLPGPDHPRGWGDYRLTGAAETAERYAALLEEEKRAGAVDAIVALTHLGLKELTSGALNGVEAQEIARRVPALDGLFTAHFHQFLQLTLGDVPSAQGGCRGQGFSVLKFTFDEDRTLLSVVPLVYDLSLEHERWAEHPDMSGLLQRYHQMAEPTLQEVVFTAEEDIHNRNMADFSLPLSGTPLSKLATDVMRRETGCQIAMTYAGRIGGEGFRKGPVTLYDFYKAYSFANILVTTQMSGTEIWDTVNIGMRTLQGDGASPLAVGGLTVTVDPARPLYHRVLRIQEEDGTDLQMDKSYSVVIEDYLASNPFGFRFPEGEALTYHNQNVRELMLQYFRSTGVLREEYPANIILKGGTEAYAGSI